MKSEPDPLIDSKRTTHSRRAFRILFDLSTVLVEIFLFDDLVRHWTDITAGLFFFVYLLYCAGLWAKRRDRAYMEGLAWFSDKTLFWLASFLTLQTVLGAMAFGSFQVFTEGFIPKGLAKFLFPLVLALLFPMAMIIMIRLIRQARKIRSEKSQPPVSFSPVLSLVSDLGIWLMGLSLLAFFYSEARKIAVPLDFTFWGIVGALFLSFLLGLLFYFPARFHVILENPRDRSNWIGFFGAMILFAWFVVNR